MPPITSALLYVHRTAIEMDLRTKQRLHNDQHGEAKIPILAYMDDLVVITETREEIENILRQVEEYCNCYEIIISEKSTYTHKDTITNRHKQENKRKQHAPSLQQKQIKQIPPSEAYKYLGFWTNLIGTWEKHKEEAQNKHTKVTNLITIYRLDPRVLQKVVNIAINTPLEFGFHSVPYKKTELQQLDVKNRKLIKKIWQISSQSPTSLVCGSKQIEGMGLRKLEHLYGEILVTDLMELINFTDKTTLYYQVGIQRLKDMEEERIIQWKETKKINTKQAQLWWGTRATRQIGVENLETKVRGKIG